MKSEIAARNHGDSNTFDKLKVPAAFVGGAALALVAASFFPRGERSDPPPVASPSVSSKPLPQEEQLAHSSAHLASLDSPSDRLPVAPLVENEPPKAAEIALTDLACDDPRFIAELNKRRELLLEAVTKAINECGITPEGLLPPQLYDTLVESPSDKLQNASNAERPEIVASTIFEMRSRLTWELRTKLDQVGTPPYLGDVEMPSNYRPEQPNQLGTFSRKTAEGETEFFLYDSINGKLCVRKIPAEWGEGALIMALRQAENAVNEVELK